MTDVQLKEILLGIPHVRSAIMSHAHRTLVPIDVVLDAIVVRLRATDLKKTRRKVEEELRHNSALTYVVGAEIGIVKDPVILLTRILSYRFMFQPC